MRLFFSLSRSLQKITDILNKDNKCFRINHQALHDYPAFVIMQWKCVVDVAPGGNVKWLRRSDALPASRCFMFPLRALWKDLLRNNKGHLEHTVSWGWADISKYDEYHAFCVRCLDINPIHFFCVWRMESCKLKTLMLLKIHLFWVLALSVHGHPGPNHENGEFTKVSLGPISHRLLRWLLMV